MQGQAPGAPDEVVWHWFGGCEGGDSLAVEVRLDGRSLYASSFPICQARRSEIRPEQPQRVLKFQFAGKTGRFAPEYRTSGTHSIEGNIWEAGGERDAVLLGVSFAADRRVLHGQVLLNTLHVALADSAASSELGAGLMIATRPVRHSSDVATTLRNILVFAPVVLGWLVAVYLQFLAFRTLRSPRPGERLFTLFFGEFGLWLFTFEGHRYRFWALIAFLAGAAVTITLVIALGM